jgi:hypothetical protein
MKNKSGGAIVEFALAVPLFLFMAAMLVFFGRAVLMRERALRAARLGADLTGTGWVAPAEVEAQVRDYLSHVDLDSSPAWEIESGRFLETPASHFYTLFQTKVSRHFGWLSLPITEAVVVEKSGGA